MPLAASWRCGRETRARDLDRQHEGTVKLFRALVERFENSVPEVSQGPGGMATTGVPLPTIAGGVEAQGLLARIWE